MKLLLLILLSATTLFTQAQELHDHVNDKTKSISMTCVFMISLICLLIAGVAYLFFTNKRRSLNENSDSGKST